MNAPLPCNPTTRPGNSGKSIVISCGPIPARVDSVKFLTNRFKGGLAMRTAMRLAECGHRVTVVTWKFTEIPTWLQEHPNVHEIIRVLDVFEYYDWFVAHAKDHDAFVMAAAVANLTPVKPFEGKFPSHLYKPGEEFDIKFMIAPRAIDAVKALNPRACLIGYKLFDTDSDEELISIARHTLADARANLIFANRPSTAKSEKIAVTADGSAFRLDFDAHIDLMDRAIRQEYFRTDVIPMTDEEKSTPEVMAAMALVRKFESTFPGYGTVAIPAGGHGFVTTSRGHKNDTPVLVRSVDPKTMTVYASGKATLNAPLLHGMLYHGLKATSLGFGESGKYVVHRHFDDPAAVPVPDDKNIVTYDCAEYGLKYVFPGTLEEYRQGRIAVETGCSRLHEPHHGYVQVMKYEPVDWAKYHETFPERYFGTPEAMKALIEKYRLTQTLEVGGNRFPDADFSYDPYVKSEGRADDVTLDDIETMRFDFAFARNAICYLTPDEIRTVLSSAEKFAANAPACMPDIKSRDDEVAVRVPAVPGKHPWDRVMHFLCLPGDRVMRHEFYAYDIGFYESLGLSCTRYRGNSVLVMKNINAEEIAGAMESR